MQVDSKKEEEKVRSINHTKNLTSKSTQKKTKKLSSKKLVLAIFFLLLVSFLILLVYSHLNWLVVAFVNGKPIWRAELIRELEKRGGKQTASFLVNKTLIYQEAKNKGIGVSESEVDELFNKYDEQFKKQGSSLKDILSFQGLTEKSYREELKFELLVKKLLADKVAVSDEEIKEYYDKNKSQFGKEQTLDMVKETIRQILSDQKLSFNYPALIQDLESKAKIKRTFDF